jgi:hypothetical protein
MNATHSSIFAAEVPGYARSVVDLAFVAAAHKLEDVAPALRTFFGFCLIVVFLADVYVFRSRRKLFGQDPNVTNDTWAVRNLRFWEVLLVWLLAMELLIEMLFRV